jgi:hypothetical protein
MNLTHEQAQAVREGEPVPVVPPEVGEECILLRRGVYEEGKRSQDLPGSRAISGLIQAAARDQDRDLEPADAYPLVDQIMADDDANDPLLASYQDGILGPLTGARCSNRNAVS